MWNKKSPLKETVILVSEQDYFKVNMKNTKNSSLYSGSYVAYETVFLMECINNGVHKAEW